MFSTNIWSRLKNQADNAFNIVNKSIQETTTGVFYSLTNSVEDNDGKEVHTREDNKEFIDTTSMTIWNSILTNVKSVNQITLADLTTETSANTQLKFKNLEEYFQSFYKNQLEDKDFTKWDLNVIFNFFN